MSVNYGLNKVRFPSPVPVGAKIRLLGDRRTRRGGRRRGVQMAAHLHRRDRGRAKPACVAQAVYRHYA